ncbi:hypothetical protein [Segnochrobactrum spirostomi]|uniref:DUF5666 domain-containing protein n=1 Tax=Segnochrobactrum spirostomi TaxID=2608987 RepID=A0A6A7Y3J7_9HYPH|nr:hypothetical protein [Segnochrobactrum spirostomi]MQT13694.1 hypothetical protein [Segnochrobactrum spirostomi]
MKTAFRNMLIALAFGASFASLPAMAQVEGGAISESVVGTVAKIDKTHRTITLKGPKGDQFTFKVNKAVKSFKNIQPGDKVTLTQTDAALADLTKPEPNAKPAVLVTEEVDAGTVDKLPRGDIIDTVTLIGKVTAIDAAKGTVTLTGPRGNTLTLTAKKDEHKAKLANVKVNDLLQVTFIRATSIVVSKG